MDQTPALPAPTGTVAQAFKDEWDSRSPIHHLLAAQENAMFYAAYALKAMQHVEMSERERDAVRKLASHAFNLLDEAVALLQPDCNRSEMFMAYWQALNPRQH